MIQTREPNKLPPQPSHRHPCHQEAHLHLEKSGKAKILEASKGTQHSEENTAQLRP